MEIKLHLPEQTFTDTPTKTQMDNCLRDIQQFLSSVAGAYLAKLEYVPSEAPMGALLQVTVQLKGTRDLFAGNSTAGLALPNADPRMVR